jgi:hypothetical protein
MRLVKFSKYARFHGGVEEVVAGCERHEPAALVAERDLHEAHVEVTGVVGDHEQVPVLGDEALPRHLHVEQPP